MRPGRAADHSPLPSAAVIKECSYTSTHPLGHTGPVTGSLYLFFINLFISLCCYCCCVLLVFVAVIFVAVAAAGIPNKQMLYKYVCVCMCVCVYRPAFLEEFERLEVELQQLYQDYLVRFRCLAYLEQQQDEDEQAEQERMEARQVTVCGLLPQRFDCSRLDFVSVSNFVLQLQHFWCDRAMPQAGLQLQRLGFNHRPIHVAFMVEKVAVAQVFLPVLWSLPVSIILVPRDGPFMSPTLHNLNS